MKISLSMLTEFLKGRLLNAFLMDESKYHYQTVQLFNDREYLPTRPGRIYISSLQEISDSFAVDPASIIITNNESITDANYPLLICRGSLSEIYEDVISAFEHYTVLDDQMNYGIRKDMDAQYFVDVIAEFFDNSVMMVDSALHVLAHSGSNPRNETDTCWQSIVENNRIPDDIINAILSSHPAETKRQRRHAFLDEGFYPFPTVSLNLLDGNIFCGRLTLIFNQSTAGNYVLDILDAIAPCLESFMAKHAIMEIQKLSISEFFWNEVLSGHMKDTTLIQQQLLRDNLEAGDDYVLLYIPMSGYTLESIPYRHMLSTLHSIFTGKILFSRKNDIIAVIRLKYYSLEQINSLLYTHFLAYKIKIGISNPFRDFLTLPVAYSQAKSASDMAQNANDHTIACIYNDYAVEHLIRNAVLTETPNTYMHPAILQILEYDKQKHTDHLNTLRIFLEEERSLTRTAARLHIHKNTLSYRLDKLNETFSIDTEHPQQRLHLMLSFRLLDAYKS